MGQSTGIEWTQATWNPWHGCHKVSQGRKGCYMFRDKARYGQDPNVVVRSKTTFKDPLKWPKVPTNCFTCSWSDFLIEEADGWRDEAYEVIRATPWITYQILTKRIERATGRIPDPPLPNIWWGVSVEDQKTADERIPLLLQTPAAVRFVSYEPALGPVDFKCFLPCVPFHCSDCVCLDCLDQRRNNGLRTVSEYLDWVIIGGESGPGARPFDIAWTRNTIAQCNAAGVACFVKQLGAKPCYHEVMEVLGFDCDTLTVYPGDERFFIGLKDRKGGDWDEWPKDLRVREFPEVRQCS